VSRARPGSGWLALAGVLLVLPVGLAEAQPSGDPETAAIVAGPFEFRPKLVFSNVGIDNNVFNEAEDPKRDFTATISPDLELTTRPGRLRLSLLSGIDYVYFRQYAGERSTNQRFAARVELDSPLVRPFVTYSAARVTSRPGHEIDTRVRHRPEAIGGGVRLELATRTAVLLSARRATVEYEPGTTFRGVELARTLNNTMTAYDGSLLLAVTPLTTLGLTAAHEETRFDFSPIRDSRSFRIAPTITISPLGLLTGTASIGYRRFEGIGPEIPSYTGLSASGALGLLLDDRYRIQTTFGRDVRYSYEESLPYFVQAAVGGSVGVYLAAGFDLRVLGGRETMDYRAFVGSESPGRDVVTTYGGGIGYRLADRVQMVLTAENVRRVSELDRTREYRNQRIFATLTWGATTR
jgi:hypothetical protein